jgi:hypothetical protein
VLFDPNLKMRWRDLTKSLDPNWGRRESQKLKKELYS